VEKAIRARRHKPVLLVDLARPRDIEAEVATLSDVYLYSLDDLAHIVDKNAGVRQVAAEKAEMVIDTFTEHFIRSQHALSTVTTVRAFRDKINNISETEVRRALHLLRIGESAEYVISLLAQSIANKVMHHPTITIKRAGYKGDATLLEAAKALFDLPT
jgi:glutamyl-tRNA reductase